MRSGARRTRPAVAASFGLVAAGVVLLGVVLLSLVGEAVRVAQVSFDVVGANGPRRYLVLAQNPAELRPTGGYIGTVGVVSLDGLRIVEREFVDVYDIDLIEGVPFVEPPEALANHLLGMNSWQLADAAWSPDFPTSAQNALRLYSLETGVTDIDGVIGINTYALDTLLEVTGPIEVPTYGVTVGAGEVTMAALRHTRGVSNADSDRKAFLNALASLVIDRLQRLTVGEALGLTSAIETMGRERSLLIWLKDPEAQRLVSEAGFEGAVRDDPGDYVHVVEANVAPTSKYNLVVGRSDMLNVTLDAAGNANSTLYMRWQNDAMLPGEPYQSVRSYSTNKAGLYGAYVRVMTPAQSELASVLGKGVDQVDAAEEESLEAGRRVFGNFLLIGPGVATLTYAWHAPSIASRAGNEWTYSLTVQKQPGLRPMPFGLQLELPPGAVVTHTSPAMVLSADGVTLRATLSEDLIIEVRYRLP